MGIPTEVLLVVLFCAFLGATGQIFFKLGSKNFSFSVKGMLLNHNFIIGTCLYATSAFLFVWSLKSGNLSVLYQLIATSHIWVVLFSCLFLKESFSLTKWCGVILILLGIAFVVK